MLFVVWGMNGRLAYQNTGVRYSCVVSIVKGSLDEKKNDHRNWVDETMCYLSLGSELWKCYDGMIINPLYLFFMDGKFITYEKKKRTTLTIS